MEDGCLVTRPGIRVPEEGVASMEDTLRPWSVFGSIRRRERGPRGRCLAGSGRWQTSSDQRQLLAWTSRR